MSTFRGLSLTRDRDSTQMYVKSKVPGSISVLGSRRNDSLTVFAVSSWSEQQANRKTKKSDHQQTVIQVCLLFVSDLPLQEKESRPVRVKSKRRLRNPLCPPSHVPSLPKIDAISQKRVCQLHCVNPHTQHPSTFCPL